MSDKSGISNKSKLMFSKKSLLRSGIPIEYLKEWDSADSKIFSLELSWLFELHIKTGYLSFNVLAKKMIKIAGEQKFAGYPKDGGNQITSLETKLRRFFKNLDVQNPKPHPQDAFIGYSVRLLWPTIHDVSLKNLGTAARKYLSSHKTKVGKTTNEGISDKLVWLATNKSILELVKQDEKHLSNVETSVLSAIICFQTKRKIYSVVSDYKNAKSKGKVEDWFEEQIPIKGAPF